MKRLDRYILVTFLANYLISLFVLVGFYVVMDMVFNFDEFTEHAGRVSAWAIVSGIGRYYLFQSFFVYSQLAGVIPVLAAAFTLMRMSRFNELTALLAAGVPLLRVAAPIILAAIGLNLLLQPINQEMIIPSLASHIARGHDHFLEGDGGSFAVRAMPDGEGGIFDAARFHPAAGAQPAWVESLTIAQRSAEGNLAQMIAAERGDWDAQARQWRLTGGYAVDDIDPPAGVESGSMLSAAAAAAASSTAPASTRASAARPITALQTTVTPTAIELFRSTNISVGAGGSYFDLLSTAQINELLGQSGQHATPELLRTKHTRLAAHVMNIVLILLAIPAVLTREPGRLRRAAGKTLLLVGGAMGTMFLCQLLAKEPPGGDFAVRWPAWMAWAPVLIFGPVAVLMLDNLES